MVRHGRLNVQKGLGFRVIIGIMENKMETTIMGCMGIIGYILLRV